METSRARIRTTRLRGHYNAIFEDVSFSACRQPLRMTAGTRFLVAGSEMLDGASGSFGCNGRRFTSTAEGDALNPDFTPEYQEFYGLALDYGVQGVPLALRDTKKIKTGLEYRPSTHLAVRAGYARHQSTVDEAGRTPVYPDLDRNYYSLGFGYEGPLFSIYQDDERVSDLMHWL